ncbi:LysE family translocator [Sediminimonas sp.]|uniref:LysE family translocator n=1 Tax=Sediminimonas sp. TaxID=2823379 RepID=UPI0025DFD7D4|nr:LysE family translocator [Sediminimonas sp.]
MIEPATLLAFVPAALALNLTPGADMMFCLGQGMRAGARPALAASAGISAGVFVHALAAGLGLRALIAALPGALEAIRWAGVAYLLWLAFGALRAGLVTGGGDALSARAAFRQGLAVNLANPKVILFVLAFVPQFVDPARPVMAQFAGLGAVLALGGFAVNAGVGLSAGGLGRRMAGSAAFARGAGWLSAGIFAALAVRLAVFQKG